MPDTTAEVLWSPRPFVKGQTQVLMLELNGIFNTQTHTSAVTLKPLTCESECTGRVRS